MKTIKVKSFLTEAIKIGDPESAPKIRKRVVDLARLAKEARKAAEKAAANGNDDLAKQLTDRADELEDLIRNVNIDQIKKNDSNADNDSDGETENDREETAEEAAARAENAANRANGAAEVAKQAADEKQAEAKEAVENGDLNADEKTKAAKEAKDAAQGAKEAADAAQAAADRAQEAADNGDVNGAKEAADEAEEAAADAQQAAKAANDSAANDGDADADADDQDGGSDGEEASQNDGKGKSGDTDGRKPSGKNKGTQDSGEGQKDSDGDSDSDDESNSDDDKASDKKDKQDSGKTDNGHTGGAGETDDDPVKDIFADDEDIPQSSFGAKPSGTEPRDPTIDEIIQQLSGLEGDAKRGAIDGLKDLLSGGTNESFDRHSLAEALKGIREMDDDEFGDLVNDTLDLIEKAQHIDTIDDAEMEERRAKISKWASSRLAKRELDQEIGMPVKKEKGTKAREKELQNYNHFMSLKDFELTFTEAIKNQVEEVLKEYQTYDEINPEYEDEGVIMKADVEKLELDEAIPRIRIYFDQSSSWNSDDIETGESVIATVKKRYADVGLCKLEIRYFDDEVTPNRNDYRLGTGTTYAWPAIIKDVEKSGVDNVIIMTDSDMHDRDYGFDKTIVVSGCVWWLWKRGKAAPRCTQHLIGHRGNYEGQFFPGETV